MQQFKQATSPYLNEIRANHCSLTLVLGYNQTDKARVRRGVRHSFGRVINVLYGMFSNTNVEFIINKIIELTKSKIQVHTQVYSHHKHYSKNLRKSEWTYQREVTFQ